MTQSIRKITKKKKEKKNKPERLPPICLYLYPLTYFVYISMLSVLLTWLGVVPSRISHSNRYAIAICQRDKKNNIFFCYSHAGVSVLVICCDSCRRKYSKINLEFNEWMHSDKEIYIFIYIHTCVYTYMCVLNYKFMLAICLHMIIGDCLSPFYFNFFVKICFSVTIVLPCFWCKQFIFGIRY